MLVIKKIEMFFFNKSTIIPSQPLSTFKLSIQKCPRTTLPLLRSTAKYATMLERAKMSIDLIAPERCGTSSQRSYVLLYWLRNVATATRQDIPSSIVLCSKRKRKSALQEKRRCVVMRQQFATPKAASVHHPTRRRNQTHLLV